MIRPTLLRFISRLNSSKIFKQTASSGISNSFIKLGRWNCTYDEAALERKIRLANEDHCGVCMEQTESKKQPYEDPFIYITECCGNMCPGCEVYNKFSK